jgi:hypothetical protein
LYRLTYFSFYQHSSGFKQRLNGGFSHDPPVPQPVEHPVDAQHPRETSNDVHNTPNVGAAVVVVGAAVVVVGAAVVVVGAAVVVVGAAVVVVGGGVVWP